MTPESTAELTVEQVIRNALTALVDDGTITYAALVQRGYNFQEAQTRLPAATIMGNPAARDVNGRFAPVIKALVLADVLTAEQLKEMGFFDGFNPTGHGLGRMEENALCMYLGVIAPASMPLEKISGPDVAELERRVAEKLTRARIAEADPLALLHLSRTPGGMQ